MGRKVKSAKFAYAKLPAMWDALRKSMQRTYDHWLYLAFVEGQPQRGNMPHFHIISLSPCPMPRLKDYVTKFGFGYQAKEETIEGWQAFNYVAKYATKQNKDTPKGFRRVRVARQWLRPPKHDGESLIVKATKETIGQYLARVAVETGVNIDKIMVEYYEQLMKKHGEET